MEDIAGWASSAEEDEDEEGEEGDEKLNGYVDELRHMADMLETVADIAGWDIESIPDDLREISKKLSSLFRTGSTEEAEVTAEDMEEGLDDE